MVLIFIGAESDALCKDNGIKGDPAMVYTVIEALAKHHQISTNKTPRYLIK